METRTRRHRRRKDKACCGFLVPWALAVLLVFAATVTRTASAVSPSEEGKSEVPARQAMAGALVTAKDKAAAVPVRTVSDFRDHVKHGHDEVEPEAPSTEPEPEPTEALYVSLDVPMSEGANTGFKSYMDFRAITNKRSMQYALQQEAETDPATGIRMKDGCYLVALGTFYAQSVGERFRITLSSGVRFDAMTGDIKADAHTDPLHQHRNGNIVEFIVDTRKISRTCRVMGDMSYAGFDGRIASIEKLSAEG